MKNFISTFVLFFGIIHSIFSQVNIREEADVSNFPVIEFTIHNRNPNVLSSSNFYFTELVKGQKIESDSFNIEQIKDTTDFSKENKCVLIVLEHLSHESRNEQNYTFFKTIEESLDDVVKEGDKFKIVTFSLKDKKTNILHDVNSDFTDNISLLKNAINNHKIENNDYTNKKVSDIYAAIVKAVEQLDDFDSNLPKSILLLSEENNNSKIKHNEYSINNAISSAKEKGIVINTIKYNLLGYQQHTVPTTLTKNTYGLREVLTRSLKNFDYVHEDKKNEAKQFIESTLNNVVERSLGVNYRVSLKSNNRINDGKDYVIEVKVNNNEIQKFNYKAPGNWVIAQFQLNVYIASGVLFLLLLILGFLIYYFWRQNKLKEIDRINRIIKQKEKEEQQEEKILAQDEKLLNIKTKEEERKKEEADKIRKDKKKQLIKQMLLKGSFPILKFSDSTHSKQFEINNPIIKVGRDKKSNSICIPNNNVSRNHFSIVFDNNEYKVIDNNSTNGIILNGRKIKEAVLNNADIIEIADVSFTFYE